MAVDYMAQCTDGVPAMLYAGKPEPKAMPAMVAALCICPARRSSQGRFTVDGLGQVVPDDLMVQRHGVCVAEYGHVGLIAWSGVHAGIAGQATRLVRARAPSMMATDWPARNR